MKREKLPRGVRRRGRSLYAYLTHVDGTFELRSIGNVTVKFADQQRNLWQREIAEGRYLKPKPRTDLVLFSDICDKAVEYFKDYTRAWDAVEGRVKRFKEWWPNRTAESITKEEIETQLRANVAPNGLCWSRTTANEYRTSLYKIYKLAIGRDEIAVNPVAATARYKLENARDRELSFAEEDRLRAAIRKLYPDKEVEFDLGLHLMCRRSNVYGIHNAKRTPMEPLQWSAVNLDFKVVSFKRSKSGKGYRVPLNETALAALKALRERCENPKEPTGAVVRKPSGIALQSSKRWFERCLMEAQIEDFNWHDLRHTAATRLRAAGVSIEDIRYLLGHGAKSITERYAHPDVEVLRKAVAKLDRNIKTQTDTKTDTGNILQIRTA